MKVIALLLVASLAANGYLLFRGPAPASAQSPATGKSPASPASTGVPPPAQSTVGPATAPRKSAISLTAASFASLLSGDLNAMVSALQAAGFTPEVIRAIVRHRIAQEYTPRLQALAARGAPYWASPYSVARSEYGLELATIEKEMSERVVALLGSDYSTPAEEAAARKEFDYLPPEKQAAAMRLVADFARRISEAGQAGISTVDLGFERREALAKLLNPQEYEQYNLRNASTSNVLRNRMQAFEPSEEEFLAVFRLERPIAEKYGGRGGPERQAEVNALQGPIAAALGPERYAEYQTKTNPQYIALDGLTRRLSLPSEAIGQTLAIQAEMQQRINAANSLPPQERQAAVVALTTEAEARLTPVLGAKGVAAYKQNGPGMWLNPGVRTVVAPNGATGVILSQ